MCVCVRGKNRSERFVARDKRQEREKRQALRNREESCVCDERLLHPVFFVVVVRSPCIACRLSCILNPHVDLFG